MRGDLTGSINKIPINLIFLQVIPKDLYFQWQIETQITSFRAHGISDRMEVCIWYPKGYNIGEWIPILNKYPEVKFFFYLDEGVDLQLYIPQLRPHTLKKHFRLHKDRLQGKQFFYHDADILFNYLPNFEVLCADEIVWQSDCSSYLDYDYMVKKEKEGNIPNNEALKKFAEIGGITVEKIEAYKGITGGAQCLLKNIDSSFWQDVENQCLEIRKAFLYGKPESINTKYFSSESAGFQSWCADMWSLNFSLWKRDISTNITKDLAFSWATDSMETYKQRSIYHNAGATGKTPELFHKGAWINKNPIGAIVPMPAETSASRVYVEAIKEVK